MSVDNARMLRSYCAAVRHPDAHGIEHDHMLHVRDGLHLVRETLSDDELEELSTADELLLKEARKFLESLQRFVDLKARRDERNVSPDQWWWYLDVLANLPKREEHTSPAKRSLAGAYT